MRLVCSSVAGVVVGHSDIRAVQHMGARLFLVGSSNYSWKLSDGT